jgi:amino acid transporter
MSREEPLLRAIGVLGLAAAILNITIGGGIFRLPALVAGLLGPGAPIAYLLVAIVMGLIVLSLAEAGSRVDSTGGPYAYLDVAFGPFVGFLSGTLLLLLGTFAWAAVAGIFASNASALLGVSGGALEKLLLVAVFAILALVNVLGVAPGTRLNTVLAVAKLCPLAVLLVVGAFFCRASNLALTEVPSTTAVARTATLLIFAFFGIETALVPGGEVHNVARTVPRAIGAAMTTVVVFYVGLQLVAQGVLGPDLAKATETPLADVAGRLMGRGGRLLLLAGATVSMFGFLSGMTLAVPRALYAFARDGFLPAVIARVHPRTRAPWVAILVQSGLVASLALTSTFEKLALLANLSALILYALCCGAVFPLRWRNVRSQGEPFRVPLVVPCLAILAILGLFATFQREEWAAVGISLVGASTLFGLTRVLGAARASAPR